MASQKDKQRVKRDRKVFAHTLLYHAAYDVLETVKDSKYSKDFIACLILGAFSLEAYLNFLGEVKFSFWSHIERIPFENKLNMICQELEIKSNFGMRPFQSVTKLWKFRNYMAHARTTTVEEVLDWSEDLNMRSDLPLYDWEKNCNELEARKILEDIKVIMDDLHEKANMQEGILGLIGEMGLTMLK